MRSQRSAGGREEEGTAAQVEAALNSKNVGVVDEEGRSATVLLEEAVDALRFVGATEAEDTWVPDQDTGVFVPARMLPTAAPTTSKPGCPCWTKRCSSMSSWRIVEQVRGGRKGWSGTQS